MSNCQARRHPASKLVQSCLLSRKRFGMTLERLFIKEDSQVGDSCFRSIVVGLGRRCLLKIGIKLQYSPYLPNFTGVTYVMMYIQIYAYCKILEQE